MTKADAFLRFGFSMVAVVICLTIPALITTFLPVSQLTLERHGDRVSAQVHTRLFLVVPSRRRVIQRVVEIDGERGHIVTDRLRGEEVVTRVRRVAFLVIHGGDDEIEIPVAPAKLEHVKQQARSFLSDRRATRLNITLVTDWLFSAAAGLCTIFAVSYFLGRVVALARRVGVFSSEGAAVPGPLEHRASRAGGGDVIGSGSLDG